MTLLISDEAVELIEQSEGLELTAYPDPANPKGIPETIGYGHTKGVVKGQTITKEEADLLLRNDLELVQSQVLAKTSKVKLNPNQLGALVSFGMNVKNWQSSSVIKYANDESQWPNVPGRLALYRLASGKVMPGLVTRRAKEGLLWLKPYGGSLDTSNAVSASLTGKNATSAFNMKGVTIASSGLALSGIAGLSDDFKHLLNNVTEAVGVPAYVVLGVAILAFGAFTLFQHWSNRK